MIDDVKPSGGQHKPTQTKQYRLDNQNRKSLEPSEDSIFNNPVNHPKVDFDIDELDLDEDKSQDKVVDEINDTEPEKAELPSEDKQEKKKSLKEKLALSWPPGKKEWITSVVIVLVCGSIIAFVLTHTGAKPVASASKLTANSPMKLVPKPTTVPSTLSGLPVAPSVNKTPVTGVMIENSDQARPQSGLGQASVVFEAVAEGGITRFLALFQDTAPTNVGPIRSARPYYLQWALGFDASLAHVGGSPDALNDIKAWGVKDLNEFYNGGAYHRISSREAPHNVYTSIAALNALEASKGFNSVNFTGFPRKADAPSKTPTAKSISLNPSWADYASHYDYDSATNSYNRSEGGATMVDANTATQISPKVVIAIIVPLSQGALDATGAYYSVYNVIGSGSAYVFQDGTVTTGTWTKSSPTSQISFTDAKGQTIKLNAGQTWITALGSANLLSYTP